jgi:hypothetical protein
MQGSRNSRFDCRLEPEALGGGGGEEMRRATWWRLFLWRLMRRFASAPFLASNYPDLPTVMEGWVILQQGHWGTLGFTHLGNYKANVLLAVFQGYDQKEGIILTEADVKVLSESFLR